MKGIQNTAKPAEEEKANFQIQMRVTATRKSRYVLEAKRNGLKMSEWIQKHMDVICNQADAERKARNEKNEPNRGQRQYDTGN